MPSPAATVPISGSAALPATGGCGLPWFPLVVVILNAYVQQTITKPRQTERTFSAVSALPSTRKRRGSRRLAMVSVNKMETLFVVEGEDEQGAFHAGCVNVSKRALVCTAGPVAEVQARLPDLHFEDAVCESADGDAVRISFVDESRPSCGLAHAARALNLMLMRKGPTCSGAGTATTSPTDSFENPSRGPR
jgi:hypothetical protein